MIVWAKRIRKGNSIMSFQMFNNTPNIQNFVEISGGGEELTQTVRGWLEVSYQI